ISHYTLVAPEVTQWFDLTSSNYFELEDTDAKEIVIHSTRGQGSAKFTNNTGTDIKIISYDKFISSIDDDTFTNGRKRCDVLLCCGGRRYFILGELKDRNLNGKAKKRKSIRKKAANQLLSSLQTLKAVPSIQRYIDTKSVKRCCYFNKKSAAPPAINATVAFNRLSQVYPDGFQMSNSDIEALGFEFY